MPLPLTRQRLADLLEPLPQFSIGLIGDLFLDRYLELADEEEHSIETGLEAYQIARVRNAPGALGTVMNNLAALGVGRLHPVTVIGEDGHGFELQRELHNMPAVRTDGIVVDPTRHTPTYTKPLRRVEGQWVELNRLDFRTRKPLAPDTTSKVVALLRETWRQCDALIVMDQISERDCGVVTDVVRRELATLANQDPNKPMLVDSREFIGEFSAGTLKGNRAEFFGAAATRPEPCDDSAPLSMDALQQIFRQLNHGRQIRQLVCTDGPNGIAVVNNQKACQVRGCPVESPIDIVGAGDSVTAAFVAATLSGADVEEAAQVANLAASVCIQKLGETGAASPHEIERARQQFVNG